MTYEARMRKCEIVQAQGGEDDQGDTRSWGLSMPSCIRVQLFFSSRAARVREVLKCFVAMAADPSVHTHAVVCRWHQGQRALSPKK
jgi:hypothetical protein